MQAPDGALAAAVQVRTLTRVNTGDILAALGWQEVRGGRRLLEALCWPAARRFARQVIAYDAEVGRAGLAHGARWILRRHVRQVLVAGDDLVPREGPLLVAANHPGLSDTMALFASLPRADVRVVAADRPFLRAIPHTSAYLIYISDEAATRLAVLRAAAGHLRAGGAVLTFPGGEIEPDPALTPAAAPALDRWAESVGLLPRLAPATRIVPAIVSGVLSPAAQRHRLARLRRRREDQERLAAMLQILVPAYRAVTVRVAFGPPVAAADLVAAGLDAAAITKLVIERARALIERPPTSWRPIFEA